MTCLRELRAPADLCQCQYDYGAFAAPAGEVLVRRSDDHAGDAEESSSSELEVRWHVPEDTERALLLCRCTIMTRALCVPATSMLLLARFTMALLATEAPDGNAPSGHL